MHLQHGYVTVSWSESSDNKAFHVWFCIAFSRYTSHIHYILSLEILGRKEQEGEKEFHALSHLGIMANMVATGLDGDYLLLSLCKAAE